MSIVSAAQSLLLSPPPLVEPPGARADARNSMTPCCCAFAPLRAVAASLSPTLAATGIPRTPNLAPALASPQLTPSPAAHLAKVEASCGDAGKSAGSLFVHWGGVALLILVRLFTKQRKDNNATSRPEAAGAFSGETRFQNYSAKMT